VRNLAARATLSQGGYERTGETGGFRANVRDMDRQRLLEEQDRVSRTEESVDRLLRAAKEAHERDPEDLGSLMHFAKLLLSRGKPEDEDLAWKLYSGAYERSGQFRFREWADDIKLRALRRRVARHREQADASPDDDALRQAYESARDRFLAAEIEAFQLRVQHYPTAMGPRFELGKRYFEAGRYDEAIPLFQEAQADAKHRIESLLHLARSFEKIEYLDEAVHTYRRAMEHHSVADDEHGLALRYGLMTALQARGARERDLASLEEADALASSIAVQQFSYRDIRLRREAIKRLIADLKRGDAA
jgi:tetratricopeptide (TPR) repeat protein